MCFQFQWNAGGIHHDAIGCCDLHLYGKTRGPILYFEARFYFDDAIPMELAQVNFFDARRIKSLQTDIFPDPDRRQLRTPIPAKLTRRLAKMWSPDKRLRNTEHRAH